MNHVSLVALDEKETNACEHVNEVVETVTWMKSTTLRFFIPSLGFHFLL